MSREVRVRYGAHEITTEQAAGHRVSEIKNQYSNTLGFDGQYVVAIVSTAPKNVGHSHTVKEDEVVEVTLRILGAQGMTVIEAVRDTVNHMNPSFRAEVYTRKQANGNRKIRPGEQIELHMKHGHIGRPRKG